MASPMENDALGKLLSQMEHESEGSDSCPDLQFLIWIGKFYFEILAIIDEGFRPYERPREHIHVLYTLVPKSFRLLECGR